MVTKENKADLINTAMIVADDRYEEAISNANKWGVTDRYSVGEPFIDEYLGGGYGRDGKYEIVTLFGDTGQNKSTFLSQMVISPACSGTKICYMALEDEVDDVIVRINKQIPGDGLIHTQLVHKCLNNIHFLPENDNYTLGNMAKVIENMFCFYDIVVIDPIQFIFEASVTESRETEFNRQRLFMRQMNNILKKTNKTLILVSHTNKGGDAKTRADAGMFKIIGSSAIAQVSTKVIEIGRDKDGFRTLRLHKSRFTPYRATAIEIKLDNDMRVTCPYDEETKSMSRRSWNGGI